MDNMPKKIKWILAISIPVILAILIAAIPSLRLWLVSSITLLGSLDIDRIKDYIRSLGFWGPAISFILMILQSIIAPLPAFVLTFANAAVYGWVWGAVLSWTSSMAGAILCFVIARFYGRDAVAKLTSVSAIESIDTFFAKHGKYAILIARLLPFISFDLVSYAAGLTSIGFVPFIIATGLGQLPATIVYSYVGGMLTGGAKAFVTALLVIFALSALVVLVKKIFADREKKTVAEKI